MKRIRVSSQENKTYFVKHINFKRMLGGREKEKTQNTKNDRRGVIPGIEPSTLGHTARDINHYAFTVLLH